MPAAKSSKMRDAVDRLRAAAAFSCIRVSNGELLAFLIGSSPVDHETADSVLWCLLGFLSRFLIFEQ